MLLVALLPLPIFYYGILRISVMIVSLYGVFSGHGVRLWPRFLVFGPPIIIWGEIYGPSREDWLPIDIIASAGFLAISAVYRVGDIVRFRRVKQLTPAGSIIPTNTSRQPSME